MSNWLDRFVSIHRFCVNQLVYPLVLSSLLACALYAGRVYISQGTRFNFLVWNLFLAWIPYACSLAITVLHSRYPRLRWLLLLPGLLWLIFLPNAPYIVTDVLHLDDHPPVPQWYEIGLFASYAWTGCFLGIVSLNQMQKIVRDWLGTVTSWFFVLGAVWLSGLGIYLGRFRQWNSWDLVFRPASVMSDLLRELAHPLQYPRPFGVTLLFAAFLLVCYLTFVSVEHRQVEKANTD